MMNNQQQTTNAINTGGFNKATMAEFDFTSELTKMIPHLRAFARSLCHQQTAADDLVQETMLKALKAKQRFDPSTNMKAWLFTILRNHFYTSKRNAWRMIDLDKEQTSLQLTKDCTQLSRIQVDEVRSALEKLPSDQREALTLVGACGFSYEEAAHICNCAIGTIKSRVARARDEIKHIISS